MLISGVFDAFKTRLVAYQVQSLTTTALHKKEQLFASGDRDLGPKGRNLIATPVRAWFKVVVGYKVRRTDGSLRNQATVAPSVLRRSRPRSHALYGRGY